MKRRAFIISTALALAAPHMATAQRKLPRIGVLRPTSADNPYTQSFHDGLRDLGYVEGATVHIDYRYSEGQQERLPALAAELVALKPDVILTDGAGIIAVKRATRTIPIVFGVVGDPVADGVVDSLARPGGNATGLSVMAPLVSTKRLEILKESVPKGTHFAVLWNEARRVHRDEIDELRAAAARLNVALTLTGFSARAQLLDTLAVGIRERAAGLVVLDDALIFNERKTITDFTVVNRWPAIYPNRGFVQAGGLMSYGPSLADLFRRAAHYVDKILKGAKPADLPVEQPTRFELIINLKAAKALDFTIPRSVLFRADEAIQ